MFSHSSSFLHLRNLIEFGDEKPAAFLPIDYISFSIAAHLLSPYPRTASARDRRFLRGIRTPFNARSARGSTVQLLAQRVRHKRKGKEEVCFRIVPLFRFDSGVTLRGKSQCAV